MTSCYHRFRHGELRFVDSDSKYRCVTKSKERLELNKVADSQHKYKMSTSFVQV